MSTIVGDNDLTPFRQRLARIVEQAGSVAALARAMNISDNAIYKWLSGRGEPNLANLIRMARVGRVSVEWLATGNPSESVSKSQSHPNADQYAFVPSYIVEGPAVQGFPIVSDQVVDYLALKLEWVRRHLRAEAGNLILIEAVGDSMSPTFSESDLLIVDLGEPRFKHEGIYVLRRDNDLFVRRIQRRPDGKLMIRSDNRAYDPCVVRGERLRIIGRVIWAGRRL